MTVHGVPAASGRGPEAPAPASRQGTSLVLQQFGAWLRQSRHRKNLRQAQQVPQQAPVPRAELDALAQQQFDRWRGGRLPDADGCDEWLQRLHVEHPSIFIYDVRGRQALARRKTGPAARHTVSPIDQRMFDKRVNHYGTLLAEVLARRDGRDRFSLAVDLADIPCDHAEFPVFAFQRLHGGGNPLLPDVDFFHHAWYLSDSDSLSYEEKSITACFAGASTGRSLSVEDIRQHASERLALAHAFQSSPRVQFRIASAVHCVDDEARALLLAQPYFSPPMPWQEQLRHRFLISVDGNGATCSRVVKSLRSNSVLVKFASPYELFYFPLLKAGEHFLPARDAQDVERYLGQEAAEPGRHAGVAAAGTAFARRVLTAPAVTDYTAMLLDHYAAIYPRR